MVRITRRSFVRGSIAGAIGSRIQMAEALRKRETDLLLVGTQTGTGSKGIYAYTFDSSSGELKDRSLATEAENPTFLVLAPDRGTVFVANEIERFEGQASGAVSSYALDRARATLTKVNEVASLGAGTCHVAVDQSGRCVFAANYGGGSVASMRAMGNGELTPAVSFFQHKGHGPDATRQESPHVHRVTVSPDNRFVLVNDLGLDEITTYALDSRTSKLSPTEWPSWRSQAGAGPRALLFHPSGRWAYCVTEMASTVEVLRWHPERGTLETAQEIAIRSKSFPGKTTGCDIVLDRQARFAYAADRFDNIIATFSVSPEDGRLMLLSRISCGGEVPRHLKLDPSGRWLLVANQQSDNISVLARDLRSGALSQVGSSRRTYGISKPQCLVFA
jgi:6-phosphogluconolactonase